jgi:hypothetical protein
VGRGEHREKVLIWRKDKKNNEEKCNIIINEYRQKMNIDTTATMRT